MLMRLRVGAVRGRCARCVCREEGRDAPGMHPPREWSPEGRSPAQQRALDGNKREPREIGGKQKSE